jgi:PTS system nitrogen regulatory IIA component
MEIKDFLRPGNVLVDLRAADKRRLLQDIAARAAAIVNVPADRIASELMKREALGSTGTGGGIAIPHARLPELKKPFGMLMRLRQAIDFEAVDEKPVDIVFLLLAPAAAAGEQLNALACVARKLRDPASVHALRDAADGAALYRAMTGTATELTRE